MSERMTLFKALHILAESHTRDDDLTGYVVGYGFDRHGRFTQGEYIEAWGVVREQMNMQHEAKETTP